MIHNGVLIFLFGFLLYLFHYFLHLENGYVHIHLETILALRTPFRLQTHILKNIPIMCPS